MGGPVTPRRAVPAVTSAVPLLVVLLVLAAGLWFGSPGLARFLLYLPDRTDPGSPPTLVGVPGEDVALEAADGTRIQGWWYEAGPGGEGDGGETSEAETAPAAVLFLHGNAGHLGHRAFQAEGMLREGLSVFLLGYRGYGRSEGRPDEAGTIADAEAALDWMSERVGGEERVVVHGRSLGGAVAAGLAARRPAVAGLVLESTFTDLEAMGAAAYPFLPGFLFRRLRGHHDTLSRVREARSPVLVVHGTADTLVPFRMGEALAEAAASSTFLQVDGAGHNDLPFVAGRNYFRQVADFVRQVTGGGTGSPGARAGG
jgi:uncharacterized protein